MQLRRVFALFTAVIPVLFVALIFTPFSVLAQVSGTDTVTSLASDTLTKAKIELRAIARSVSDDAARARREIKRARQRVSGSQQNSSKSRNLLKSRFQTITAQMSSNIFLIDSIPALQNYYRSWSTQSLAPIASIAQNFGAAAAARQTRSYRLVTELSYATLRSHIRNAIRRSARNAAFSVGTTDLAALQHRTRLTTATLDSQVQLLAELAQHHEQFRQQLITVAISLNGVDRNQAKLITNNLRQSIYQQLATAEAAVASANIELSSSSLILQSARLQGGIESIRSAELRVEQALTNVEQKQILRNTLSDYFDIARGLDFTIIDPDVPVAAGAPLGIALADSIATEINFIQVLSTAFNAQNNAFKAILQETNPEILAVQLQRVAASLRLIDINGLGFMAVSIGTFRTNLTNLSLQYDLGLSYGQTALTAFLPILDSSTQDLSAVKNRAINNNPGLLSQAASLEAQLRDPSQAGSASVRTAVETKASEITTLLTQYSAVIAQSQWSLYLEDIYNQLLTKTALTTAERASVRAAILPLIQQATLRGKQFSREPLKTDLLTRCRSLECNRTVQQKILPVLRARRAIVRTLNKRLQQSISLRSGFAPSQFKDLVNAKIAELSSIGQP